MAKYTQAQLDQLRDMIAKGVTSMSVGGEQLTFRSLAEMRETERMMAADLSTAAAPQTRVYPSMTRGT
ncbi:MAG: hypothetical protein AAFN94_00805 [Pseudomonadota bacterium]